MKALVPLPATIASRGAWSLETVASFLRASVVPVRLSTLDGNNWPSIVSLWYLPRDGAIWCCTQQTAATAARLAKDRRCAFEVAGDSPPYRGVRGKACAELIPSSGPQVLEELIARYLGNGNAQLSAWLRRRSDTEVAIRLQPQTLYSWDYSLRMHGSDAPQSPLATADSLTPSPPPSPRNLEKTD